MWVDILVEPYDYDVLQQIRQKIHDLGLPIIVIQYNQKFQTHHSNRNRRRG